MNVKEFIKSHRALKKTVKLLIYISMLPVLIPIGFLMNLRKAVLTPRAEKTDAIGVLGRGVSLKEASQLAFLDDFIIVNMEAKDLNTEPVRSLLKGKRIIHFVNIGEGVLPPLQLLRYSVYRYVIARLKPDGSSAVMRSPRKVYATERFGFKTDYLPEEMAPYLKDAPNAGMVAIVYAAVALKKRHIYMAGFDFYQTGYLTGPLRESEPELPTIASEKMIRYIGNFMAQYPDTNFHFVTASSFNPNL